MGRARRAMGSVFVMELCDGNHFMGNYMYFITWAQLIGFEYYMYPTHYSIT